MASRASLNKVLLIGNLTRDPEMRYTPSGAAVCTFGIATNRYYTASDGEKKEETEFIKIVSWNKLAELCSQLLAKGRKVYVEGRMQTRSWETPDGQSRQTTEVVIDDMRILDSKKSYEESAGDDAYPSANQVSAPEADETAPVVNTKPKGDEPASDEQGLKGNKKAGAKGAKKDEEPEKSDKADAGGADLDDLPF